MRYFVLCSVICLCAVGALEADIILHLELEGNADDSANSHDGTIYGNPATVAGPVGQALDFDGNGYIAVPHHADLSPINAMTVSAWFKPNSFNLGTYSWPAIMKKYNDSERSGFSMEIGQVYESTPKVSIIVNSLAGNESTTAYPVSTDTWYYLAGTYEYNSDTDQSTLTTYFGSNFQPLQSSFTTFSGPLKFSSENLNIGRDNWNTNSSRYFDGIIDDVRIYNETLTGTQINDLYIPEPSTFIICSLFAICVLCLRWHR